MVPAPLQLSCWARLCSTPARVLQARIELVYLDPPSPNWTGFVRSFQMVFARFRGVTNGSSPKRVKSPNLVTSHVHKVTSWPGSTPGKSQWTLELGARDIKLMRRRQRLNRQLLSGVQRLDDPRRFDVGTVLAEPLLADGEGVHRRDRLRRATVVSTSMSP